MIDSKQKGSTAELKVRNILRQFTGLPFERTPLSGALDAKHGLKSDIYIPNERNVYAIEVKHYAEDHIDSKILTGKDPQLLQFWKQTIREAEQTNKQPLLIFKFNRSKFFVAYKPMPTSDYRYMYMCLEGHEFYVSVLEVWLEHEKPKFI